MAEFPAKVSTETSSTAARGGASGSGFQSFTSHFISVDLQYLRSIPGILLLAEIVLGLLVWALVSSTSYTRVPAYGWVMFVSITLWLLSVILLAILTLGIQQRFGFLPWQLLVLLFDGIAALLYLTAFLANAASVEPYRGSTDYNHLAAAAFFGILVTLTYSASTFFAFTAWRGEGGNAASTTVPV
ncbi:plasmolipin-like isoform X2 [Arapaima gigas]